MEDSDKQAACVQKKGLSLGRLCCELSIEVRRCAAYPRLVDWKAVDGGWPRPSSVLTHATLHFNLTIH